MYKGCTRDTQRTTGLAMPEQSWSNALSRRMLVALPPCLSGCRGGSLGPLAGAGQPLGTVSPIRGAHGVTRPTFPGLGQS